MLLNLLGRTGHYKSSVMLTITKVQKITTKAKRQRKLNKTVHMASS